MSETEALTVRSFDTLAAAAAAVNALVDVGFEHGAIELRVIEDEAGPAQGNFIIGNGATTHGGAPGAIRVGPDAPYNGNFRHPKDRSVHLVIVQTPDAEQRRRAEDVMQQAGGHDVQDVADAAAHR